jgi:hypothetical protein
MLIDNTEALKTIGIIVGLGAAAWVAYNIPTAIALVKTQLLTIAQWNLNAALNANPIGFIVAGIALLAAGLIIAWRHSETFRGAIKGLWASAKVVFENLKNTFTQFPTIVIEALKAIPGAIVAVFKDVGRIIKAVFTGDFAALPDLLKSAGKNLIKANPLLGPGLKIGQALAKGTRTAFNREMDKEALDAGDKLIANAAGGAGGGAPDPTAPGGAAPDAGKAAGISTVSSKAPKQINIAIDSLVKEFNLTSNTFEEGADKLKERITQVLLEAVNDASLSMR